MLTGDARAVPLQCGDDGGRSRDDLTDGQLTVQRAAGQTRLVVVRELDSRH